MWLYAAQVSLRLNAFVGVMRDHIAAIIVGVGLPVLFFALLCYLEDRAGIRRD
jgi:hypothetical protein